MTKRESGTGPAVVDRQSEDGGHGYTPDQEREIIAAVLAVSGATADELDAPTFLARAWRYQSEHRVELATSAAAAGCTPRVFAALAAAAAAPQSADGALPPPSDPKLIAVVASALEAGASKLWEPDPTAGHDEAGEPEPRPQCGLPPGEGGLSEEQKRTLLDMVPIARGGLSAEAVIDEIEAAAAFLPQQAEKLTPKEREKRERRDFERRATAALATWEALGAAMLAHIADLEAAPETTPHRTAAFHAELRHARFLSDASRPVHRGRGKKANSRDFRAFVEALADTWSRATSKRPGSRPSPTELPSPFVRFVVGVAACYGWNLTPATAAKHAKTVISKRRKAARL